MSDVIIPYRFLIRGGLAAALASTNEIVKDRELEIETDTGKFKLGDGVTHYNDLPYIGFGNFNLTGLADGYQIYWDASAGEWVVGPAGGLPITNAGDLIYGFADSNGVVSAERLPIGTLGQVLKVSPSGVPYWDTSSGSGDVVGPGSSTNNHVVFFDGVTGKLIKDSGLTLAGVNTGDQTLGGLGGQPLDAQLTDIAGISFNQGDILYFNGTNLTKLAPGTAGHVLKTGGAGANPSYGAVGVGDASAVQVDIYDTPGVTTWNKPAGAKYIEVVAFGGGGGGGGGAKRATNNTGPGGGGGGARMIVKFDESDVGSSETVTVGAGGTGGLGQAIDAGTQGTAGGNSSFGSLVTAYGGGAGSGNTAGGSCGGGGGAGTRGAGGNGAPIVAGAAGAGGGSAGQISGATAIAENTTYNGGGASGSSASNGAGRAGGDAVGGGAGGGAGTGGLVQNPGGNGGVSYQGMTAAAGGTASGGNGGNGSTPATIYGAGTGGGGGATSNVALQNGGDGGNGGRASGGGGGGTCGGTGTRGGNGGNGGDGLVAVITYF